MAFFVGSREKDLLEDVVMRFAWFPRFVASLCLILVGLSSSEGSAQTTSDGAVVKTAKSNAPTNVEESWQVIHIGDQRVGYLHGQERTEVRDGRKVIITTSNSQFQIKRFGQQLNIATTLRTEETQNGDLLKYRFELKNPPVQSTSTEGVVVDNELELTTTVSGRSDKKRIPWESDAKSPAYPDRVLRARPLKPGQAFSTKVFLAEFNKFSKVTFNADEMRPTKLLDGKEVSLLKVRVSFSAIPENNSRQFLDSSGRTIVSESDMLGLVARSFDVPRDVALQAIAGAELDIAVNTLIRIDPPILDAHRKKRIVYKVSTADESPERFLVAGGTQQIRPLTANSVELTVVRKPIPPANSKPVSTDPKFLAPTRFLQSRDSLVVEHAEQAASGETDPCRIAALMEKYVHKRLSKKNFSTAMASAAEVAKHLEGDCTEHAVLLAAMLRVKKVPSRVAAGLVYADKLNSFGGHMWTEAFLAGEWIPLDATLGQGGIGAAHIKMADSALDEDAPLPVTTLLPLFQGIGKLKFELVKAE